MADCTMHGAGHDWVARAAALSSAIAAAAERTEREGRVAPEAMAALHEAGLFRLCLPRALDGAEASPMTILAVLQAVAAADASTAWCLGQALGCSLAAGFVAPEIAREIFGPADAVLAWGPPNPRSRAVPVEGGWRVTGRWSYASGIRNATWLGGHARVCAPDGTPLPTADGRPVLRTALFRAASAEIVPVWDVIGLRGTGSDDYVVEDLFVPEAYTYTRDLARDRHGPGPLHRIAQTAFYGIAFAGVALGIARASLDSFIALAAEKTPAYTAATLRENAAVQLQVARCEGELGAGRAFLVEMSSELWDAVRRERELSLAQRARLRIACTYASERARKVVDYTYHAAGAGAILRRNPFERRFRDMHAVAQQIQAAPTNFEHAGMALLGLDPGARV